MDIAPQKKLTYTALIIHHQQPTSYQQVYSSVADEKHLKRIGSRTPGFLKLCGLLIKKVLRIYNIESQNRLIIDQ
jgi:hypothetical protein